jgi:hypothetical protein
MKLSANEDQQYECIINEQMDKYWQYVVPFFVPHNSHASKACQALRHQT